MSKITIWLTPLWLLSVGLAVGSVLLLVFWLILRAVNPRAGHAFVDGINESVLRPISYALAGATAFAILASPAMPWQRMVDSLKRIPAARSFVVEVTVPAKTTDFKVPAMFRASELTSYKITSDQNVAVNSTEGRGYIEPLIQVPSDEGYAWQPGAQAVRAFEGDVSTLYVTNDTDSPAKVTIDVHADVEMPQVHHLAIAAGSVVGLFALYFGIRVLAPRASVIAAATAKETISQPTFILLTAIGIVALLAFVFTPYNTFGEDVKMLKTTGMTTIKILAIIMALWTASSSVSEEIEGRTALTVLSKPVSRRQFILGKFLGIFWPIVLMFVILGIAFLVAVSFKVVYDARESAKVTPEWTECYAEVARIIPGLVLAFFESIIMAAISVAVSTRLPMLPNLVVCGSIYVLGHLAALIVKTSANELVFVRFIGRLLSVILPVLDHFEIEGAIAGATSVPMAYLGWALVYTLLYCGAAMLLALIFFEDRDLA